jgi:hypothetical protein
MTLEELFGNVTETNYLNQLQNSLRLIDGNLTINECREYLTKRITEIQQYQQETLPKKLAAYSAKYHGKYFMIQYIDTSANQNTKMSTFLHITKAEGGVRYGDMDALIWGEELYRYNNAFHIKSLKGSDKEQSSTFDYISNFTGGSGTMIEITEEEYNQRKQLFQQLETLFPFNETKESV